MVGTGKRPTWSGPRCIGAALLLLAAVSRAEPPPSSRFPAPAQLHLVDSWGLEQSSLDGTVLIARIHQGAEAIMGHPAYGTMAAVAVRCNETAQNGMPTHAEGDALYAIEDGLRATLERNNESLLVAVVTNGGWRNFVFYTTAPENVKKHLTELEPVTRSHHVELTVTPDKNWGAYRRLARLREQKFWSWFAAHDAALQTIRTAKEPIADDLAAALHEIHPRLTFEIGPAGEEPRELIVSADGDRSAFPAVERLVEAAPPSRKWKIIAFRQRMRGRTTIQLEGLVFDPAALVFSVEPHTPGVPLSMTVYVKELRPENRELMSRGVALVLQSLLGEHDLALRFAKVELKPLPTTPAAATLLPLTSLAAMVDQGK